MRLWRRARSKPSGGMVHRDRKKRRRCTSWQTKSSGSDGTQAIPGEIDAFTDADAGVTDEQEGITGDIVTAQEFLLDVLILFESQGTRKPGIGLRHVIGMEKANQGGQILEPSQFLGQAAQRDDMQGASAFDQRWFLRREPFQPAQNVRVPPQLIKGLDTRVMLAQKAEKVFRGGSIAAIGRLAHRSSYRFNSRKEHLGQGMIERQAAPAAHEWDGGMGRIS